MTKQELQKIIQEAVRREVKKEIKKIFIKEETNTQLKSVAPQKPKPITIGVKTLSYNFDFLNLILKGSPCIQ